MDIWNPYFRKVPKWAMAAQLTQANAPRLIEDGVIKLDRDGYYCERPNGDRVHLEIGDWLVCNQGDVADAIFPISDAEFSRFFTKLTWGNGG